MIAGIIFDMDGVLIDSEPVYLRESYEFLKNRGIDVTYQELYKLIGISSTKFWQTLADKWNGEVTCEEIQAWYNDEVPSFNYRTILFPHVTRLLSWIKEKGLKIGLASSSPLQNIKTVLKDCEIESYFDVIVSGDSFKESKPNPEIYLTTANYLNLAPSQCLAVEDSFVGIMAAKRAGMYVVAKEERRFGFDQKHADKIVLDLLELLEVIEIKTTSS